MGIINNLDRFLQTEELRRQIRALLQGGVSGGGGGIKLTSQGYDADNKKLINLATGTANSDALQKQQVDAIANQLRASSLQVDGTSHMTGNLDLRNQNLINPGEIKMNRKLITNLNTDENNDLSAVNMATLKRFGGGVTKDIDLKTQYNVKNSKPQTFVNLKANPNSLVSFDDAQNTFLSRVETFAMKADLNMDNHTIFNVKDPTVADQGANKKYVDAEVTKINQKTVSNRTEIARVETDVGIDMTVLEGKTLALTGGTMTGDLDMGGKSIKNLGTPRSASGAVSTLVVQGLLTNYLAKVGGKMLGQIDMDEHKIINLPHPTNLSDAVTKRYADQKFNTPSGSLKNVFQYIMNDVNETSSEFGITVLGILDFPQSPHLLNKKAIKFQMGAQSNDPSRYYSRLALNFFSLPRGEYTLVAECFPPTPTNIELSFLSTSININHQINGVAGNAWKNVAQVSKNTTSPPVYLMVDMKCDVVQNASNIEWLVVWGVAGFHSSLPSSIYDQPFVFESGKMVMETDLDLNGKSLINSPKSQSAFLGKFISGDIQHGNRIQFSDSSSLANWGLAFTLKNVHFNVTRRGGSFNPHNITLEIHAWVHGGKSRKKTVAGSFRRGSAALMDFPFNFSVSAIEWFSLQIIKLDTLRQANVVLLVEI